MSQKLDMSNVTILGRGYRLKDPQRKPCNIVLPDSDRKGHFWCFGTTRSGKTRLMEEMIVQDITKGYSVVVIDPKGDMELLSNIIFSAIINNRLDDLIFISPIYPEYSAIIDPLSYYYMPEELVGHIVSGVEVGKEPFFYNVAYEISLMVVLYLIEKTKVENEKFHFSLLDIKNKISRSDMESILEDVNAMAMNKPHLKQLALDIDKILQSPQDYYSKVSSSLRVALTELTSGNIGKIIGKADSNRFIRRLEEKKRVILVAQLGSLMTRRAAFTLGKVLISMIQSFVGRTFASGRNVQPPLALYIDEAQNVLYFGIEDLFAKAGGAGVWIHGFSQSVNQLYKATDEHGAKSILDNTNTKVFMRVPDTETAEYASSHFGVKRILSPILSSSGGLSSREVEDDVVKYEELLDLQPRLLYMLSYTGAFKGKTLDTDVVIPKMVDKNGNAVKFEIEFPEINLLSEK